MSIFSTQLEDAPLLTEAQIQQLISTAPVNTAQHERRLSQRARAGEQSSSISGSGSDFAEVRDYQPGDDLRHIDWRATARSQKPLVRTYYSEFSTPLCLVIDRRTAMRYATRNRLKVTQALRMALWLGGREARRGREISVIILDTPCHWLAPQQGMLSLKLMIRLANKPCPPVPEDSSSAESWKKILSGIKQQVSADSDVFIFSDFCGLSDADNHLLQLLGHHYSLRAIQLMDPSEDYRHAAGVLPDSVQFHWADEHSASLTNLTNALEKHQAAMTQRFRKAGIEHFHLGVEQDDLSAFSLKYAL